MARSTKAKRSPWIWAALALLPGCAPTVDSTTELGRAAIIEKTHELLTSGRCADAIVTIEPLYQSAYVDNRARMARASAFACAAGITDFLTLINVLPSKSLLSVPGEGSYLFRTAVELFYGTDTPILNSRIEYGTESMMSLLAGVKTDVYVLTSNLLYDGTNNPGSASAADRTDDANLYMIFVSMATMGAVQSRYGAPESTTWKKGQTLGYTSPGVDWSLASQVKGSGCAYAAAVLNLLDSSEESLPKVSENLANTLSALTEMRPLINAACDAGCTGTSGSGCGIATGCSECPASLRDPTSCTGTVTNRPSCAAAGLIQFINTNTNYGWVGP